MSSAEKRGLIWPGRLILFGLVVELLSLFGLHHPFGFMSFAMLGCSLIGAGMLLYIISAARGAT